MQVYVLFGGEGGGGGGGNLTEHRIPQQIQTGGVGGVGGIEGGREEKKWSLHWPPLSAPFHWNLLTPRSAATVLLLLSMMWSRKQIVYSVIQHTFILNPLKTTTKLKSTCLHNRNNTQKRFLWGRRVQLAVSDQNTTPYLTLMLVWFAGVAWDFFSLSRLSAQTLLRCLYSPWVQSHASTPVHALKIPKLTAIILFAHIKMLHTRVAMGRAALGAAVAIPR